MFQLILDFVIQSYPQMSTFGHAQSIPIQGIPKVQGTIGFFVAFLGLLRAFDGALMALRANSGSAKAASCTSGE